MDTKTKTFWVNGSLDDLLFDGLLIRELSKSVDSRILGEVKHLDLRGALRHSDNHESGVGVMLNNRANKEIIGVEIFTKKNYVLTDDSIINHIYSAIDRFGGDKGFKFETNGYGFFVKQAHLGAVLEQLGENFPNNEMYKKILTALDLRFTEYNGTLIINTDLGFVFFHKQKQRRAYTWAYREKQDFTLVSYQNKQDGLFISTTTNDDVGRFEMRTMKKYFPMMARQIKERYVHNVLNFFKQNYDCDFSTRRWKVSYQVPVK
ncbi:hypothetical protein HOC35_04075 [Candidatus Woesearchaeota archaeon]|jgi:hypothetical protein|nr:hypothetical protein [Candidatus Woesearchaeota archaeon]